ncbi:MAG: DUF5995 family protein [Pseudonocardiaceae bacterium]
MLLAPDPAIPPLRHQLVGLNAHLNFDLPQVLLAVMSNEDWPAPCSSPGDTPTSRIST